MWKSAFLTAAFVSCFVSATAADSVEPDPALLVITGIGGEPRFDERFHAWASTLMDAARERGLEESAIFYLAGDPDRDPERARGRSNQEAVTAAFDELAADLEPAAPLFVVVIGHGSHRDGVSKVNLPGPDMSAEDFAAALEPLGDRPLVFANLTSASGGFVPVLSGPGRVVVTATRSGLERDATVFARFFAAAFVGDEADLDHNGRLTVREAFDYASREVERDYEREQKLRTEHAVLDDPGEWASRLSLGAARAASPVAAGDPELAGLQAQKEELESRVAALRDRKEELAGEEYERRLEELLIELALVNRSIRER